MPVDPRQREQRLTAIREIIGAHSVRSQADLVRRLTELGLSVTQSSVSRDLRSLPISKVGGAYRITPRGDVGVDSAVLREAMRDAVTGITSAGPNLVVVPHRHRGRVPGRQHRRQRSVARDRRDRRGG